MGERSENLLRPIERYYSAKLQARGATPAGVDWKDEQSQRLRFEQLARVISTPEPFSINDLGCGYGAFFGFLAGRFGEFSYRGIDIAASMVEAAQGRFGSDSRCSFHVGAACKECADYTIASGIFNVRLDTDSDRWRQHVLDSIGNMAAFSRCGFAFNCLTIYSDPDRMRNDLYYADPGALFDYCKRRHGRNVALLHDYGLYEFTLIVRKEIGPT